VDARKARSADTLLVGQQRLQAVLASKRPRKRLAHNV